MMRNFLFIGCIFLLAVIGTSAAPVVSISAPVPTAIESGRSNALVVVSRSGETNQNLVVEYTIGGSARNGSDYVRLPGRVTIPRGAYSATISVQGLDDGLEEPSETIDLRLASNLRPYTLVLLPDTQYYTDMASKNLDMLASQIRWIIDEKDARNIVYVLHEGDCTQNNDPIEWGNFRRYMRLMDGVVPYAIAVGNHDGLMTPAEDTAAFSQFFPVNIYKAWPTFGGVFESNKMDNCYHLFSAGGVDWLLLSLEFGPREPALQWANTVVSNYPTRKAILLTHTHIYNDDTLHGSSPTHFWTATSYGRTNNGTDVWEKFLKLHSNMSFVFNGHVLNDGAGRLVGTADSGNKVYQMLANYQMFVNGGSAYLRIVEFFPAEDRFTVKTYSPKLRSYWSSPKQEFEYRNLGIFDPSRQSYTIDPSRSEVHLTLLDDDRDDVPPSIVDVRALGLPSEIRVRFNEPIDPASATDLSNYSVDPNVDLVSAALEPDGLTVALTTLLPLNPDVTYILSATGVKDRAMTPNAMPRAEIEFAYLPVLMTESFDDELLRNWTIVDEGTIDRPSSWNVRYGRLEQSANIYGPSPSAIINRAGTYTFWNRPAAFGWSNYVVSLTLRSGDDDALGIFFRYRDPANYYKIELDAQRNFRQLVKKVGGQEFLLANEAGGYHQNQDMRLVVQADGTNILTTLDGLPLFGGPVRDNSISSGSVALYCWGDEGAVFDDVVVTPGAVPASATGTNSEPAVTTTLRTLQAMDGPWRFWSNAQAPSGDWTQLAFDDNSWSGPAAAVFASPPGPPDEAPNTWLPFGPVTYYFRQPFLFSGSTNAVTLRLRTLLDDAAIFYLNGKEIFRLGMPDGPVFPNTLAVREIDYAELEGPFDIDVNNLITGTNLLAAEVHRVSVFSEDVVFAAELEAVIPVPKAAKFLSVKGLFNGHVQAIFSGEVGRSYSFESSIDLKNWQQFQTRSNIPNPTISVMLDATKNPGQFFRAVTLP